MLGIVFPAPGGARVPPAIAALAALTLLAGCEESAGEPGPGVETIGEKRALDRATGMLDEQRLAEDPAQQPPTEKGIS
jgi:hypothetical protein